MFIPKDLIFLHYPGVRPGDCTVAPGLARDLQSAFKHTVMGVDVLRQLRNAIVAGDTISIDSSSVIINGSMRLDRKASTNFKSLYGRGANYSLEAVYFQYHFRDLPYDQYFQSCRNEQVQHVIMIDKKDLLAYLVGAIDTCPELVSPDDDPSDIPRSSSNTAAVAHPSDPSVSSSTAHAKPISTAPKATSKGAKSSPLNEDDTPNFSKYRHRVRDQRSIDSVLMVKDWDFSSLREKLSQHVASAKKSKPSGDASQSSKPNSFDPRGDRYTSNEDRFWRENLGSEFHELGIDMSGSFKAKPSDVAPAQPSNSTARPRDDRSRGPTRDDRNRGPVRDTNRGRESTDASQTSAAKDAAPKRQKIDPKRATPIIMVPSGLTSLICSANALEFFQNGHFMSEEEMRKDMSKVSQTARASMIRKPGGNCSAAEYHIVSNPNRLNADEWRQVVAVVSTGQRWQFQSWPIFEGSALTLFRKVQGIYFHFDDVVPSNEVESWALKKLSISREKRHTDSQVQAQFWNCVDSFIARNRLPLRY